MAIAASVPFNCHRGGERETDRERAPRAACEYRSFVLRAWGTGLVGEASSWWQRPSGVGTLGTGGSPVDRSWVGLLRPAGRGERPALCRYGILEGLSEKRGVNLSHLLLCVSCPSDKSDKESETSEGFLAHDL